MLALVWGFILRGLVLKSLFQVFLFYVHSERLGMGDVVP